MTGHTAGPWEVWTSCSWRRICNGGGEHVCTPVVHSDGQPDLHFPNGGSDGPDARLIAAAPELLSIAQRWAAIDGGAWNIVRHAADRAELEADTLAAIAKATGEIA